VFVELVRFIFIWQLDDRTAELVRLLLPTASGIKIRKTFVIDHPSLKNLSKFASENDFARNEAVERLLLLYQPVVEKNRRERYENQKKVQSLWREVQDAATRFEQQATQVLPEEDPILEHFLEEVSAAKKRSGGWLLDDGEPVMEEIF
jgi:hypothetical protein